MKYALTTISALLLLASPVSANQYRAQFGSLGDLELSQGTTGQQSANTTPEADPVYNSCMDHMEAGATSSGTYTIGDSDTPVYCDMTTNGGGWMMYIDFGESTARPALVRNGISNATLFNSVTNSYARSSFNGETSTSVHEYRYDRHRSGWINFHNSGTSIGFAEFLSPEGYTEMRVDYGNGYYYNQSQPSWTVDVLVNSNLVSSATLSSVRGDINAQTAIFPISISGNDSVIIQESRPVAYLDAIWIR